MKSPITGHKGTPAFKVGDYQYWKDNTGSLYGEPVDQSGMVGGTGDRRQQEIGRMARLNAACVDSVLDYGCGGGHLVQVLREHGIDAVGYDKFSEQYGQKPSRKFSAVCLVEVVEHLCAPFDELKEVYGMLQDGGMVYIETSFSNWVGNGHPYANPTIGHNTIFSHIGLDFLMLKMGFRVGDHIDSNTRIYWK